MRIPLKILRDVYAKVFDLGTERRVWPWSVYVCMIGYFFVVMWMTSHFSG